MTCCFFNIHLLYFLTGISRQANLDTIRGRCSNLKEGFGRILSAKQQGKRRRVDGKRCRCVRIKFVRSAITVTRIGERK